MDLHCQKVTIIKYLHHCLKRVLLVSQLNILTLWPDLRGGASILELILALGLPRWALHFWPISCEPLSTDLEAGSHLAFAATLQRLPSPLFGPDSQGHSLARGPDSHSSGRRGEKVSRDGHWFWRPENWAWVQAVP